jgi:ubiquinone/menaquinone biosynthesis C-methylase UbiE
MPDTEREWQEAHGAQLQIDAYGRLGTRMVFQRQFALVARAADLGAGHRVLDLGCGAGLFLAWLSSRSDLRLHGIDISLASLRAAHGRAPSARLTLSDAERLPYADRSFDRVVCNGAAHHLPHLEVAFMELKRILVPGGRLVLFEPTATGFANAVRRVALRGHRYESPADHEHKHELEQERFPRALSEAGFRVVSVSHHDWLAYPLSGMYVNLPIGRRRGATRWLLRAEERLNSVPSLKRVSDKFAWRILVVADASASEPRA